MWCDVMSLDCLLAGSLLVVYVCFFFFKQKTAYEMRISDWSSDVCSSDLVIFAQPVLDRSRFPRLHRERDADALHPRRALLRPERGKIGADAGAAVDHVRLIERAHPLEHRELIAQPAVDEHRSEEHTSELQSLMRISYAVFCLKTQQQRQR